MLSESDVAARIRRPGKIRIILRDDGSLNCKMPDFTNCPGEKRQFLRDDLYRWQVFIC